MIDYDHIVNRPRRIADNIVALLDSPTYKMCRLLAAKPIIVHTLLPMELDRAVELILEKHPEHGDVKVTGDRFHWQTPESIIDEIRSIPERLFRDAHYIFYFENKKLARSMEELGGAINGAVDVLILDGI